jgi:hypothetical protein
MGAVQGVQAAPAASDEVKNVGVDANKAPPPKDETEALAQQMLKLASTLYKQYHPQLNDVELCKRMGLAVANKLESLDQYQLEALHAKQNGKGILRPVFLASNDTRFQLETDMGTLPDYFNNKYVSVPEGINKEGKKLSFPYIANRIRDILEANKPLQRAFQPRNFKKGKRFKRRNRRNQAGGQNHGNTEKLQKFEQALEQVRGKQLNVKRNNRRQMSNQLKNVRINIAQVANRPKNNKNNKNNNVKNEEAEGAETITNIPETEEETEETDEENENSAQVAKNLEDAEANIVGQPVEEVVKEEEVIPEPEPEPKRNNNQKNNKKNNNQKNNKKNNNQRNNKNNKNNKSLSKSELCKVIAHHYMVRANLVAAIASALPLSNMRPSFCQQRLNALERGQICLPPDYENLQAMSSDQAAKRLAPYIRNFHKRACQEAKGFMKYQGKEKMGAIFSGDTELQKQYTALVKSMKSRYIASLKSLKEILEKLLDNTNLTNDDLQNISQTVKKVLDDMYTDCQYDYVLGVITLLQVDYQMPKMSPTGQTNLKNALQERNQ